MYGCITRTRCHLVLPILVLVLLTVGGCLPSSKQPPDTLIYSLPSAITIDKGESIPGTQIVYESMGDNGANVLISGQRALKRKGDSLDWQGDLVDGASGVFKLRIVWYTEDALTVAGTSRVEVRGVRPTPGAISTTSPIKIGGPIAYQVKRGRAIPGSTITYEERTPDGVRLGGIPDYPYRKGGDSIFWEGTLRDRVYLRLDLRLLQYDSSTMRVGGIVTLWLGS